MTGMGKGFYKNLKLVLDELDRRIPKTNKDGFLPSEKVLEAIEYFKPMIEPSQSENDSSSKGTWLQQN